MQWALVPASIAWLLVAPASAQPGLRGIPIEVADGEDERSVVATYVLTGPDGSELSRGVCAEWCAIEVGWWHGAGRYTLAVTAPLGAATQSVELDGTEIGLRARIDLDPTGTTLALWVQRSDPRLDARVADDLSTIEIVNGSDVEVRYWDQEGAHWFLEPAGPVRDEADRRARSASSWGFCATLLVHRPIAAGARPRLDLSSAMPLPAPGRYRGLVVLDPPDDPGTAATVEWIVSFDVEVVPGSAPSALVARRARPLAGSSTGRGDR